MFQNVAQSDLNGDTSFNMSVNVGRRSDDPDPDLTNVDHFVSVPELPQPPYSSDILSMEIATLLV